MVKHTINCGAINIRTLSLDISLQDILNADRIELPELYDLRHAQIMEALYKIKDLLDRQEMLNYIQSYLDPTDDIPQWVNFHPDKISQLLAWWEVYLDDETTYREALNLAFDKMMREEFKKMKIVLDTTLGEMTFDVEPVLYGKWKLVRPGVYECSECGRRVETGLYVKLEDFPYCHCGAKMTEGPDNRILYLKRGK